MIRAIAEADLPGCAKILMSVYNNELWQCRWTLARAQDYLFEYFIAKLFVGYVLLDEGQIIGAIFCHEKIWWNNNELFVDEMFIQPSEQRKGYGAQLLQTAENYVNKHRLAGFTLATNRFTFAPGFYRKNGFSDAEHVLFMYKEC
jgi:aminoglycoside 6'-N-acetyltransferase I